MQFSRASLAVLSICFLIGAAPFEPSQIRLEDSSDWWSYTRQEEDQLEQVPPLKYRNREPARSNFQIAGIKLGAARDFSNIRSRLGKSTLVERGDAASGRQQICYVSSSGNVRLIFEFGEVNSAVYLFKSGQEWKGMGLCSKSNAISTKTSTSSGLMLGITTDKVKSILGEPSTDLPDKKIYNFSYKRKTDPNTLAKLRESSPEMTEAEFAENFKYLDGEVYIETRFTAGKLVFLAISKTETY